MTMQGEQLKDIRKAVGLSQEGMAGLLGMSQKFVGQMERGDYPIERRTEWAAHFIYADMAGPCFYHRERGGDVALAEAMIIWDRADARLDPPVKVVRADGRDDDRYSCSRGACDDDWNLGSDVFRLLRLFALVQHMTLVEKLDPRAVHDALLVIPEYRSLLPHDPRLGLEREDDE